MPLLFMDPGQLNARLDLESPTDTPDGQGGVTSLWSATAALWARIEPVSMERQEIANQIAASVTHRIWIRFRSDLSVAKRFRKGTRLFDIQSMQDPDETGRYLVCLCTEVRP